MSFLLSLIMVVLRAFLPVLLDNAKDTAQDAATQPELKKRLRDRVRKTWGPTVVVLLCLFCLAGCFKRTIYISNGEPVRLRETIQNAKVWIKNRDGEVVAGQVDLQEGWYCLPVPSEDDLE